MMAVWVQGRNGWKPGEVQSVTGTGRSGWTGQACGVGPVSPVDEVGRTGPFDLVCPVGPIGLVDPFHPFDQV